MITDHRQRIRDLESILETDLPPPPPAHYRQAPIPDLDLVAAVARRRPNWHFVFIGDVAVQTGDAGSLNNVHFLGPRGYDELPGYCRQLDAAMIPFKVNELTRSVNPIKLREYLAAGLGVVSTPLPEVRGFNGLVEIAAGPDEFAAAVERILRTGDRKRRERMDAVRGESWPRKLEAICGRLMSRGTDPPATREASRCAC